MKRNNNNGKNSIPFRRGKDKLKKGKQNRRVVPLLYTTTDIPNISFNIMENTCAICGFGLGNERIHAHAGNIGACGQCMRKIINLQIKNGNKECFCPICLQTLTEFHLNQYNKKEEPIANDLSKKNEKQLLINDNNSNNNNNNNNCNMNNNNNNNNSNNNNNNNNINNNSNNNNFNNINNNDNNNDNNSDNNNYNSIYNSNYNNDNNNNDSKYLGVRFDEKKNDINSNKKNEEKTNDIKNSNSDFKDKIKANNRQTKNLLSDRPYIQSDNRCPVCRSKAVFSSSGNSSSVDSSNNIQNNKNNCIRCPNCLVEFCCLCGEFPFHYNQLCEEKGASKKARKNPIHCFSCGEPTESFSFCESQKCKAKQVLFCNKRNACGHFCDGYRDEQIHPPCRFCSNEPVCVVCNELYGESPRMKLKCGHSVHRSCFKKDGLINSNGVLVFPKCIKCDISLTHEELQISKLLTEGDENILVDINSAVESYCTANLIYNMEEIFRNRNIYVCEKHKKKVVFICGTKIDPVFSVDDMCPVCNCDKIPICPLHKHASMSYKCCKCCATASHAIMQADGRMTFSCECCFQLNVFSKVMETPVCQQICRFAPHSDSGSKIVGRCEKCKRIFSL